MSDRIDKAMKAMTEKFTAGIDPAYRPYFAAYCEIQDAAPTAAGDAETVAGAAVMHIAKLLTDFDGQIDDESRRELIHVAGGLWNLAGVGGETSHGA